MKKTLIIVLAALMVCSALGFAGSTAEKATATGTITLRVMEHQDRWNVNPKIFGIYEQRNPNIKIEYLQNPEGGANAVHDKLVTMLAARDSTVDIFVTDVIWPPELAAAGWLLPLDEWFPPEEQRKHVPAMIDAQTVNGKIYGVPFLNDIGHLFYRTDLLEGGGMKVPELWSELVEISQKLQGPDMFGYVGCFFPDQQLICNYLEFLWSNGGHFLDETGTKVRFTEKESIEAVQFMVDMMQRYRITQPGITTMSLDDGRIIFTEGKAVFHRNWNYVYALGQNHPDSKIKGKVGTSVLPRFPNGKHASTLGGWSYSVNAYSRNSAEAAKLAAFLGGPEAQKIRALEGERTPTILPLLSDPDILAVYPVYAEWQKEADSARARPKSPFYTQLSDIFQRELQEALLQRKTPAQAMRDAASGMEMVLK